MVRSVALVIFSTLCGWCFDKLKVMYPVHDYYYRFIPFWVLLFQILALAAAWRLYNAWKALGGDDHYKPPAVDIEKQVPGEAAALANSGL
jgi:hypothetical protein